MRHTERPEYLVRISIVALGHDLDRMQQTAPGAARRVIGDQARGDDLTDAPPRASINIAATSFELANLN